MSFTIVVLLTFSIVIPALIGLVRFRKINQAYHPFIFFIWLGLLNETISYILVKKGYHNTINVNIYLLIEFLVLSWQFKRWKLFEKRLLLFKIIIFLGVLLWLSENFIFSSIRVFNSYFRIAYSTLFTFLSIGLINRLIITERKTLIRNPVFILCAAFAIYYTLNILSETFWLYGLSEGTIFRLSIYNISVVTNFISILLYSYSILWMPFKQKFTLPSS